MRIRATVNSTIAIKVLHGADLDVNAGLILTVGAMTEQAKAYCDQMISITDHTLKELAEMGYPYATRDPQNPHDPPEQVHEQEGKLRAGLRAEKPVVNRDSVTAYVHNVEQPLDTYIQVGTRTMIGRPYMDAVRRLFSKQVQQIGIDMMNRVIEGIKRKWAA